MPRTQTERVLEKLRITQLGERVLKTESET